MVFRHVAHAGSGASIIELTVTETAKTRAVIQKAYRLKFRFVCPISDTGFLNFS
jgi:hypothetical protein